MADGETEFVYTAADFSRVREMLHDHSGISLGESKRSMVYNRLARRLRARNLLRFDHYLDFIQSDEAEWEACINALTTNLTSFFREPHHFDVMAEYVKRRHLPKLRIWCTAASTGEEPYSIAMTMIEAYNSDKPPVEIIASDIDTDVLAHAQRGVYALRAVIDRVRPAPGALLSTRRWAQYRFRARSPGAAHAHRLPAHQPARSVVAAACRHRYHHLPQRAYLFRAARATTNFAAFRLADRR